MDSIIYERAVLVSFWNLRILGSYPQTQTELHEAMIECDEN